MTIPVQRVPIDISRTPERCPFCASVISLTTHINAWEAQERGNPDNAALLYEHYCSSSICGGRSFWT